MIYTVHSLLFFCRLASWKSLFMPGHKDIKRGLDFTVSSCPANNCNNVQVIKKIIIAHTLDFLLWTFKAAALFIFCWENKNLEENRGQFNNFFSFLCDDTADCSISSRSSRSTINSRVGRVENNQIYFVGQKNWIWSAQRPRENSLSLYNFVLLFSLHIFADWAEQEEGAWYWFFLKFSFALSLSLFISVVDSDGVLLLLLLLVSIIAQNLYGNSSSWMKNCFFLARSRNSTKVLSLSLFL